MPNTTKGTPYVVSTDLVANYPTESLALANHIDANLQYNTQDINAQTGTTYTFALADATLYKLVTATNAAASTYTVPPQSSVTWVTGSVLRVLNQGAGVVTLAGGSGVTLNGSTLTLNQYQYAELHRTASNTWTVTGISTPPGLTLVGQASPSAVTSVSIDNCFTATYENYRMVIDLVSSTAAQNIFFRMRAGGSDNTGSNYAYQYLYGFGTTVSPARATAQTSGWFFTADSAYRAIATYDIGGPAVARQTSVVGHQLYAAGTVELIVWANNHNQATAYDGITFLCTSGNFTGSIRIYGYRNS